MSVLFVLIPTALILAALAVGAFAWSAKSGQLDDLETPAVRILFDDSPRVANGTKPRDDTKRRDA